MYVPNGAAKAVATVKPPKMNAMVLATFSGATQADGKRGSQREKEPVGRSRYDTACQKHGKTSVEPLPYIHYLTLSGIIGI